MLLVLQVRMRPWIVLDAGAGICDCGLSGVWCVRTRVAAGRHFFHHEVVKDGGRLVTLFQFVPSACH